MRLPIGILANPFRFVQFMQVIVKSERPVVEIDGYPENATKVQLLDATQTKQIVDLAKRIVESHKGNTPIVAFAVRGHADLALRNIPTGKTREEFEQDVSDQRAVSARNALLSELVKLPRGASIAAAMPFTADGFGSTERKHKPIGGRPLTDKQMKENRRVEFFIAQFTKPLPRKEQPPPPPKPPEVGSNWRIQITSGVSVSTILPPPADDLTVANVTLFFTITDLDRKERASFRANVTGGVLPSVSIGVPSAIQSESFTQGSPVDFKTTGGVRLAQFAGDVEIAQEPGAGVSVLSAGGNFDFSFKTIENNRIFTRPSVVSVPAGSPALSLPKAALGFAAGIGSVTMRGNPTAVP
jgi:hypothetical protein